MFIVTATVICLELFKCSLIICRPYLHCVIIIIIVVIIIIIIIPVITVMQGIYNYIPETNHVSRVYSVAAVLYLQSVLHVMSFRQ